ncbi:MAG: hypothetical protein OEP48_02540 [Betaproteobacteria bacterium]|nr:hypothetical protein [Betaproteobacteria bacterium]MDH3437717.1 hypothetical protein [Betaproteobacteria bacterium]
MSQAASAPSLWIGSPRPARERLSKAVVALTRARRLQVLVDHGFGGLLAGLGLATFAVLVARLVPLPYPPWQLGGAAVIIAVALALLVGWQRRPDALDVAIRADLTLNLKQRLSTAWEFMTVHDDVKLAERLAVQAVKAGLPARTGLVFPWQVNRWGRLSPLAATALLLVSVIDLNWMQAPVPHEVDEQVVSEGQRLGAFGRAMQERARRDRLPRSARQAAQLERLGARMESGALTRGDALGQLRGMDESLDKERMQALAEANQTDIGPLREESSPIAPDLDPGAMLERMQRGALDSADTRALAEHLADLERSGIPRRDLEDTLRRHLSGDNEGLREMLEKLAQIDRARKEGKELQGAREQVRRARENLGESLAGTDGERGPAVHMDWGEDEDRGVKGAANAGADGRQERETTRGATGSGSQGDSSVALDRQRAPVRPDPGQSGPVLKPQSQARKGEVFVTQAQVRPRSGRPSVENVVMSSEFASQVEEVLSKEQYPAHYKEFVRRYFLNLSQGRVPQQQPTDKRGAQ